MNKKTMTLEQYNKKYRNRTEYLIKLKKSEADAYNKKFEHVVGNQYLFNGRKWQLIGDTYYQIPRPISYTWFRNLHAGVQVATCALLGAIVVGGAATPFILNYLNGDYIVVDSKEVIFTYSKDDAGNINANIKTIDNTYEIKSIVVKTSDYEFIKDQDYTYNVESGDIYIKSESIKEHQGKIHVVPAVTAVQVESVDCERTLIISHNGSKPASDLHVTYYPENTHDKSINDYELADDAPFEIVENTNGKYTLKAKNNASGTAKLTLYSGNENAKVETECFVTVLSAVESYDHLTFTPITGSDTECSVCLSSDWTEAYPKNLVIPSKDPKTGRVVTTITYSTQQILGVDPYIETVTLPNTLREISTGAFANWRSLKAINFDGTSSLTTLGASPFASCTSLEWIKISDKLSSIGEKCFSNCTSIKFVLEEGSQNFSVTNKGTILFNKNKTELISAASSSGSIDLSIYPNLSKINIASFFNTKITDIKFPSKLKDIPSECFQGCSALKTVTFTDDSVLETIGFQSFNKCSLLNSIVFPKTLKSIGVNAFQFSGLTSAEFKNTSDRWTIGNEGETPKKEDYDVSNPGVNATSLKTEYNAYLWTRN